MLIKKVESKCIDYVVYEDYFADGGFPCLIRETFPKHVGYNNLDILPKGSNILVAGSSNWKNFFFVLKSHFHRKDLNIFLAPLGQLSEFLDYDNPFEFGDKVLDASWKLSKQGKRRREKGKSFTFRFLYRRLWRLVIVRFLLRISSGAYILSKHEAGEVRKLCGSTRLYAISDWAYKPYDKRGQKLELPESKLNLLYFGRIDPFYKGLYELIDVMTHTSNTKLYLSGGDYRGGVLKLRNYIRKAGLGDRVEFISKDMDSIMFARFNYTILPSYWEGYYRACADVKYNGGKLIIRDLSNGDFFVDEHDFIFRSKANLIEILSALEEPD